MTLTLFVRCLEWGLGNSGFVNRWERICLASRFLHPPGGQVWRQMQGQQTGLSYPEEVATAGSLEQLSLEGGRPSLQLERRDGGHSQTWEWGVISLRVYLIICSKCLPLELSRARSLKSPSQERLRGQSLRGFTGRWEGPSSSHEGSRSLPQRSPPGHPRGKQPAWGLSVTCPWTSGS